MPRWLTLSCAGLFTGWSTVKKVRSRSNTSCVSNCAATVRRNVRVQKSNQRVSAHRPKSSLLAVALVMMLCLWTVPAYAFGGPIEDPSDPETKPNDALQVEKVEDAEKATSEEAPPLLSKDELPAIDAPDPSAQAPSRNDMRVEPGEHGAPKPGNDNPPELKEEKGIFAELWSNNELHFSNSFVGDVIELVPLAVPRINHGWHEGGRLEEKGASRDGRVDVRTDPRGDDVGDASEATSLARYSVGTGDFSEDSRPPWYEKRDAIYSVSFDEGVRPQSMALWFDGLASLVQVDFTGLDTSNVSSMRRLFGGCSSLATVDVSGFDTSGVTDMSQMFSGCSSLTALDLSAFDTSSLESLDGMLEGCSSLTALNVSSFASQQQELVRQSVAGFMQQSSADPNSSHKVEKPNQQASAANLSAGFATTPERAVVNGAGASSPYGSANAQIGPSASNDAELLSGFDASAETVPQIAVSGASESLPVAKQSTAPTLDPGAVADTTASVLSILGVHGAVDKAFGMAVAAAGMVVAAGLLLALCLKIR